MKKSFIRIFLILFVLGTVMNCMTGCQTDGNTENGSTESNTSTAPDSPNQPYIVTLNGVPLQDYAIVYVVSDDKLEFNVAEDIRVLLQDTFKIRLKVKGESNSTPQRAIVVGSLKQAAITDTTLSIGENEWCLTADSDRVYLLSKSQYGYEQALEALTKQIVAAKESLAITVPSNTKQNFEDKKMTTMTFNIRNWDKSEGHLYRIKQMILQYKPDVIGFQEMSNRSGYEWVNKLLADSAIADLYAHIGEDRKDSTGEQCAIFYRKDTFTLVKGETRWLYCTHGINCTSTDCKGETNPGRFEGISYSASEHFRIMTYARLKRISDGKEITFINTHLELGSETYLGVNKQTKQIDYVLNLAKELTDKGETVVITGDFNATLNSAACKKILQAGFQCAEKESENFVGQELADGEKYLSENKYMATKIDHIFVSSPSCYFETYTYCDQKIEYAGVEDYASDHIPRIAHLIID